MLKLLLEAFYFALDILYLSLQLMYLCIKLCLGISWVAYTAYYFVNLRFESVRLLLN